MTCCLFGRSVEPLQVLLGWGADMRLSDELHGNTAAHLAVRSNNLSAVLQLDEAGVDWRMTNNLGLYPYQVSSSTFCYALGAGVLFYLIRSFVHLQGVNRKMD